MGGKESGNTEDIVMPYLDALALFRDDVRLAARSIGGDAVPILKKCDELRDDVLPLLGVRLENKENEPTVIKLVDKEELMKEKEEKRIAEEKKKKQRKRYILQSISKPQSLKGNFPNLMKKECLRTM